MKECSRLSRANGSRIPPPMRRGRSPMDAEGVFNAFGDGEAEKVVRRHGGKSGSRSFPGRSSASRSRRRRPWRSPSGLNSVRCTPASAYCICRRRARARAPCRRRRIHGVVVLGLARAQVAQRGRDGAVIGTRFAKVSEGCVADVIGVPDDQSQRALRRLSAGSAACRAAASRRIAARRSGDGRCSLLPAGADPSRRNGPRRSSRNASSSLQIRRARRRDPRAGT